MAFRALDVITGESSQMGRNARLVPFAGFIHGFAQGLQGQPSAVEGGAGSFAGRTNPTAVGLMA